MSEALPVDFSMLIVNLAAAAMVHLGEIPDPETGEKTQTPRLAQNSIDTIKMLEDKTKGNLTDDEAELVRTVIKDLSGKLAAG